jgi:hypothetical protein
MRGGWWHVAAGRGLRAGRSGAFVTPPRRAKRVTNPRETGREGMGMGGLRSDHLIFWVVPETLHPAAVAKPLELQTIITVI